ncbi:hypothetical protein B4Q13_15905, partial [Lacticaseibacillus rhamnosus]
MRTFEAGAENLGRVAQALAGGGAAGADSALGADLLEVDAVVPAGDRGRVVDVNDVSALEQHRSVAEPLHSRHVVGDEQNRASFLAKARELVEAFLL